MSIDSNQMIAPCGLDCNQCDIYRIRHDDEAAQRVIKWYKSRGWLGENDGVTQAIQKRMYCLGCRGDRNLHWTPNCHMLTCCLDDKKLQFCHQCADFPCEQLSKWAQDSVRHGEALERLKSMRSNQL